MKTEIKVKCSVGGTSSIIEKTFEGETWNRALENEATFFHLIKKDGKWIDLVDRKIRGC